MLTPERWVNNLACFSRDVVEGSGVPYALVAKLSALP